MSVEKIWVAASADDWDTASTNNQYIAAKSIYTSPPVSWDAYTQYDLTHIDLGVETVFDYRLHFYNHYMFKSRSIPTFGQLFWWYNTTTLTYSLVTAKVTAGTPATGWDNSGWLGSVIAGWIKSEVTKFRYTVSPAATFYNPGDSIIWQMRSYDYSGVDYTPYLEIRHGYSEDTARTSIIGA